MGVYIKDMEMPKKCGTCDFRVNDFTCLASSGAVLKVLYKRPEWCPLVEVKGPHGDLIDRDQLVLPPEDIGSKFAVKYAPAVIKAEGGE